MNRIFVLIFFMSVFIFAQGTHCFSQEREASVEAINELKQEIQKLRKQMEAEKRAHEVRLKEMQDKIDAVSSLLVDKAAAGAEEDLEALKRIAEGKAAAAKSAAKKRSRNKGAEK